MGKKYTISLQLWSFGKLSEWVDWWHYVLPDENDPVINVDYALKKATFSWATSTYKNMTLIVCSTVFNSSGRQYMLSSASQNTFEIPLNEGTWYWCTWMASVDPLFGIPKVTYLYLTPIEVLPLIGGDSSDCDQDSNSGGSSEKHVLGYDEQLTQMRIGPSDTVSSLPDFFPKKCLKCFVRRYGSKLNSKKTSHFQV